MPRKKGSTPVHGRPTAFHLKIRDARRRRRLTIDEVATAAGLGFRPGGAARHGEQWLYSVEAGRTTNVSQDECLRLDAALRLPSGTLWGLLLLDGRKLDPEIRAYYESGHPAPGTPAWPAPHVVIDGVWYVPMIDSTSGLDPGVIGIFAMMSADEQRAVLEDYLGFPVARPTAAP